MRDPNKQTKEKRVDVVVVMEKNARNPWATVSFGEVDVLREWRKRGMLSSGEDNTRNP
jgi:hypothetical protein